MIIAHGYVITCDGHNRAGRLNLLVREGRIAEVSENFESMRASHPHAQVFDASSKLIVPGFVNAHFHSESLLYRDLTAGKHFSLWRSDPKIRERSISLLGSAAVDDLRSLYTYSSFRHIKVGTTCAGEYPPAVEERGFGAITGAIARAELRSRVALQNWSQIEHARTERHHPYHVSVSIGRESDFTIYSFENHSRAARDLGAPLAVHVAEQRDDAEIIRRKFQKSLLTLLRDAGVLRSGVQLIHLNHLSDMEVELLASAGVTAIICPRSAAEKQNGYPSLRAILGRNVPVALGTDWWNMDMIEEMRFLRELPSLFGGIHNLTASSILRSATINGACALGFDDQTGSIESGKRCDLTIFDIDELRIGPLPHAPGAEELSALLIDRMTSRDITEVMIDGQFCLRDGRLTSVVEEDVVTAFRKTLDTVTAGGRRQTQKTAIPKIEEPRPAKIISFVSRDTNLSAAGFEEGFVRVGQISTAPPAEPNVPPPVQPAKRPFDPRASMPELSKNVKRVFGDDDDV